MNAWGYAEDSRDAGQWSDQALGQAEGRVRAQRCTAHLQIDPRATGATACGGGEVIAQGSRRSGAQIWAGGLTGLGAAGATGRQAASSIQPNRYSGGRQASKV